MSISKLAAKIFPTRAICCLKHTSHTGEHSLIPARGKDGLGMRLHRQVARTMNIADPIVEIEGMLTLHMEMVCNVPIY